MAVETLVRCMRSDDERTAMLASEILLSRGWGKPEISAEVTTVHRFVEAPQVLNQEEWLATRGQGYAAMEPKKLCPDAMHEGNILDLKVESDPTKKPN
jgi:hypothetical protein